jgi:hypothetical protein
MDNLKVAAEEKKVKGNEEHKKGNYPLALRYYSEAIGNQPF